MKMENYRERFPAIRDGLNFQSNNSYGLVSDQGVEAMEDYKNAWIERGRPWEDYFLDKHEELRSEFAKLINAKSEEIAILPDTSATTSRILNSMEYDDKNKLLVSSLNFPTIGHVAMTQEKKRGAKVEFVPPYDESEPDFINLRPTPEDYEKQIDENTKAVLLTGTCFRNGFVQTELEEITKIAHDYGAYVIVDDGHYCGVMDRNVKDIGVDFLVSTANKYLMGGTGDALTYISKDVRPALDPLEVGWLGEENPFEFDIYNTKRHPDAKGFECGSFRIPTDYTTSAGIKMLNEVGTENVEKHVRGLLDYLWDRLHEEGFESTSPEDSDKRSLVTIVVPEREPHDVDHELFEKYNTVVSPRQGVLRIAPHFYNTKEELDDLLGYLHELM
ncbi:MAG: aminotransferase class V-fold PLP-dependent enzyme [Thermoplasmata archaeon]